MEICMRWKESLIEKLCETALLPAGRTLYIWGGGWNESDTGAGADAVSMGISQAWEEFFLSQDASYDFKKHRMERRKGLDCSGYIGWLLYNTLAPYGFPDDYVRKAGEQGRMLEEKGFGNWKEPSEISGWHPGDIMSSASQGHVYLVLEECEDGSLLICHSSPPGVQVNGTVRSDGRIRSEAVQKAEACMRWIAPEWCRRYNQFWKGGEYLREYGQFRWE